jgi:hypothetical protein
MPSRRGLAIACVSLLPAGASAANTAKKRTPVVWDFAPCMTVVDSSLDPVLHLPYTIAKEDPAAGEPPPVGEPPGSRTHQFFAYAREHPDFFFLPNWITDVDVAASATLYLVDPADVDPEDVLESSTIWAGQWTRITQDTDRRPITFDVAAEGVDWDTSALAPGTYSVQGYTYEPAFNLYSRRPGVIKVVDGGSPDAYGPAAAFEPGELLLYRNSTVVLRGCVDAMDGSTLTGEWALLTAQLSWTPFVEDLEVEDGELALELAVPSALVGASGLVRATVHDPMGREYTTHMTAAITVLDEDDPSPCPDPCGGTGTGVDGAAENTGAGDATSAVTGESTGTDRAPGDGPQPGGCGCSPRSPFDVSANVWWWCLLARRRARPHLAESRARA